MLKSKYIGLLFLVLAILMACQYPSPVTSSEDMPQKTRDSVNYLVERHYTLNSNFEVTSDSLMLQQLPLVDVLPVFKGERLVVAEFMIQPADSVDSVWVYFYWEETHQRKSHAHQHHYRRNGWSHPFGDACLCGFQRSSG